MTELGKFPVRDEIRAAESGHGYALRMASANGLNGLADVKKMLGKTRFAVLDAADAGEISRWFGAEPLRLALALGHTGIGSEPEAYELGGLRLSRSYFINRSQPRICCACLAKDGYCRLAWELCVVTTCSLHSTTLCQACPNCGQALRWDRPHLSQCRCGWVLGSVACETPVAEEIDVACWIERAFRMDARPSPTTPLGRLLDPLSLDAGLHILSALASVKHGRTRHATSIQPQLRKRNSLASAREAIANAAVALDQLARGRQGHWRVPVSAMELLAEACASSYAAADRQLAISILASLRCKPATANWGSRFPQTSQLPLL